MLLSHQKLVIKDDRVRVNGENRETEETVEDSLHSP